jgi:activator of the mannose operon (transcriptional antiterminator)
MAMNSRQIQLLKLLLAEDDYRTVRFYANKVHASERTVNSDLKEIDSFLKQKFAIALIKKRGVGISVKTNEDQKLRIFNLISRDKGANDVSIIERRESILKILLQNESAVNFRKLADDFYVSVSSISTDMKAIEKWLMKFAISLIKNQHGTTISGSEINIRKAMIALIQQQYQRLTATGKGRSHLQSNKKALLCALSLLVKEKNSHHAKQLVHYLESQLNCKFSEFYYVNMIIISAVILQRLAQKKWIEAVDLDKNMTSMTDIHTLKTYIIAKDALEKYSKQAINDKEIQFLNFYMMSSGMDRQIGTGDYQKYSANVKSLAKKMCKLVGSALQLDLSNDRILYQGLLAHLEPMIHRLKNGIVIRNPLLNQIKKQYPAMYGLSFLLGPLIENETHSSVDENEIGFLMVHFQAAVERNTSLTKVIVVCPNGIGMSELVASKMKQILPNIQVIGVCSVRTLSTVNLDSIDFIVSTVPLPSMGKPVIVVSPMLNLADAKVINHYYLENLYNKANLSLPKFEHLLSFIRNDTIFLQQKRNNKHELIKAMTQKLSQKGYVNDHFQYSVENRENIASTDLGNGVAIPHGDSHDVYDSTIAVATLNRPISWGKYDVQLVFLIAMRHDANHEIKNVMGDLYQLLESNSLINKLTQVETVPEMRQLLTQPKDANRR